MSLPGIILFELNGYAFGIKPFFCRIRIESPLIIELQYETYSRIHPPYKTASALTRAY